MSLPRAWCHVLEPTCSRFVVVSTCHPTWRICSYRKAKWDPRPKLASGLGLPLSNHVLFCVGGYLRSVFWQHLILSAQASPLSNIFNTKCFRISECFMNKAHSISLIEITFQWRNRWSDVLFSAFQISLKRCELCFQQSLSLIKGQCQAAALLKELLIEASISISKQQTKPCM